MTVTTRSSRADVVNSPSGPLEVPNAANVGTPAIAAHIGTPNANVETPVDAEREQEDLDDESETRDAMDEEDFDETAPQDKDLLDYEETYSETEAKRTILPSTLPPKMTMWS